jgi:hypothetical protein
MTKSNIAFQHSADRGRCIWCVSVTFVPMLKFHFKDAFWAEMVKSLLKSETPYHDNMTKLVSQFRSRQSHHGHA